MATEVDQGSKKNPIDRHDLIMILLLLVISLRSAVWNVFQLIHENNYEWLIAIGLSAFVGKIAGGWLADKIGWRLYAILSLLSAAPLLSFFKNEMLLFSLGIGLLQSGIPATTSLLIESLKGKTARGISLSFGTAIILGAMACLLPQQLIITNISFILIISFLILILCGFWFRQLPKARA